MQLLHYMALALAFNSGSNLLYYRAARCTLQIRLFLTHIRSDSIYNDNWDLIVFYNKLLFYYYFIGISTFGLEKNKKKKMQKRNDSIFVAVIESENWNNKTVIITTWLPFLDIISKFEDFHFTFFQFFRFKEKKRTRI